VLIAPHSKPPRTAFEAANLYLNAPLTNAWRRSAHVPAQALLLAYHLQTWFRQAIRFALSIFFFHVVLRALLAEIPQLSI
jgi:hypothetical protein